MDEDLICPVTSLSGCGSRTPNPNAQPIRDKFGGEPSKVDKDLYIGTPVDV